MLALALYLGLTVPGLAADLEDNYEIFTVIGQEYTIRGPNGWGGSVLAGHDGVKDKAGNVVIPADYIDLSFLGHSNALVARKHIGTSGYAYGIIDINQNVLVPFQYTLIQRMWTGKGSKYLTIEDSNTFRHGVLGPDFSIIVPMEYGSVDLLSEEDSYFLVSSPDGQTLNPSVFGGYNRNGGKYGVCDKNGTLIIPCEYDLIEYLGEGYFAVRKRKLKVYTTAKAGLCYPWNMRKLSGLPMQELAVVEIRLLFASMCQRNTATEPPQVRPLRIPANSGQRPG